MICTHFVDFVNQKYFFNTNILWEIYVIYSLHVLFRRDVSHWVQKMSPRPFQIARKFRWNFYLATIFRFILIFIGNYQHLIYVFFLEFCPSVRLLDKWILDTDQFPIGTFINRYKSKERWCLLETQITSSKLSSYTARGGYYRQKFWIL